VIEHILKDVSQSQDQMDVKKGIYLVNFVQAELISC